MERADKIFVVLAMLALVVVLISKGTPRKDHNKMPRSVLMLSEPLCIDLVGPTYLTSNIPVYRDSDDNMPTVSADVDGSDIIGAAAG